MSIHYSHYFCPCYCFYFYDVQFRVVPIAPLFPHLFRKLEIQVAFPHLPSPLADKLKLDVQAKALLFIIFFLLIEVEEEIIEEGDDTQEVDEEDHGKEGSPALHLQDTKWFLEDRSGSQATKYVTMV